MLMLFNTFSSLHFDRFEELAAKNQMNALHYLQTSLSEIIDHNDPEQTKEVSRNTLLCVPCFSLVHSEVRNIQDWVTWYP